VRASLLFIVVAACGPVAGPTAPAGAHGVVIDRFSATAAHLMVRDDRNGLPAAGAPIDLDVPPFVTHGLGPDGAHVHYYNFDVQPDRPARMYRLVGADRAPIAGQPAIVDVIPGDVGYSDFWKLAYVRAPDGFVAGSIDRADQLRGLPIEIDTRAIDCPIVPRGTTAREGSPERIELAYRGARIECLRFGEPISLSGDDVPTSPIYVTFAHEKIFRTEPGAAAQTHNVVLSVPGDADYSPLWAVHVYDPSAFDRVHDEASATAAPLVNPAGPHVNCPVVSVAP
jgi:hypothetical protein